MAMKVGAPVIGSMTPAAPAFRKALLRSEAMPKCSSATSTPAAYPADQPDHGPCAGGAVYSPSMTDFIFM